MHQMWPFNRCFLKSLTLFRLLQFTIAIPCEGSYCRPLIALALALSPLWFGFYLYIQFDANLWDIRIVIFLSVMTLLGMLVIRYAPGGDGTMIAYISVPVALYGFVVAATWIGELTVFGCVWLFTCIYLLNPFLGIHMPINRLHSRQAG